jgi:hypothetical protein
VLYQYLINQRFGPRILHIHIAIRMKFFIHLGHSKFGTYSSHDLASAILLLYNIKPSKRWAEQRSAFRRSQMEGILASCWSITAIEFQAEPSFSR